MDHTGQQTNFTLQRNLCTNAVAGLQWAGLARQALEFYQARRGWAQARGSPELANSGLRALDEARKTNFTLQRNLCKNAVGELRWAWLAGEVLGSNWPGKISPGRGKALSFASGGLRALGEARTRLDSSRRWLVWACLSLPGLGWAGLRWPGLA